MRFDDSIWCKVGQILPVGVRAGGSLFLLAILLFACGDPTGKRTERSYNLKPTEQAIVDKSFLTGVPCEPPCWQGLKIGHSTKEEVHQKLRQLPFIDQKSIQESQVNWEEYGISDIITYGCIAPQDGRCGGLDFDQEKLVSLWAVIGYKLDFATVLEKLSKPDLVAYVRHTPGGNCLVILVWRQKEISIDGNLDGPCPTLREIKSKVKLDPRIQVTALFYGHRNNDWKTIDEGGPYAPWPGFIEP